MKECCIVKNITIGSMRGYWERVVGKSEGFHVFLKKISEFYFFGIVEFGWGSVSVSVF